jgi:4-hydroxybenzoate polyprenyltransferase
MKSLPLILRDIRIEHTLFALPFAVMSAFIAAGGMPETRMLALIIIAMFFARSAAMAFNRLADARFDATNPRTANRALASKKAGAISYIVFIIVSSATFCITAWYINPLAFMLSPVALSVIFLYSYTKRFTAYSHFFLGFALSLAPIGAWVAVRGEITTVPLLLGTAVLFWLVGLDIIYSCQDIDHDKSARLYSIPSRFGIERALRISYIAHIFMIIFLLLSSVFAPQLGTVYIAGVILTAALLWYEHSLVKPNDLTKVNEAFFNVNGVISVGLMIFTVADTLLS